MRVPIVLADAFTDTPGAGNRAGVVLEAHGLDERVMRAVARAIGASETAFCVSKEDAEVRTFRFFTSRDEIPFCGHATVAAMIRLVELARVAVPSTLHVETLGGRIAIELSKTAAGRIHVSMDVPIAASRPAPLSPTFVLELCRGRAEMLDPRLPALAYGAQVFIPVTSRRDLFSLAPRFDALADAGRAHGLRGFYLFTRDTLNPDALAHARYFAPIAGVREDPVTGSAAGALGHLLATSGVFSLPEEGGVVRFQIEQGDVLGRPGRIDLEVRGRADALERIRVGGVAVSVIVGHVEI